MIIALMSAMIPFLSSCNEDDSAVSEWDMSYVSLLPVDYLRPAPSFSLSHVEDQGIEGTVEFQVVVTVQKAFRQDIKVNLNASCEGISADNIDFTSKIAVVKAGSITSEPITVSITNWEDLLSVTTAADYLLKIKIDNIEANASEVTLSNFYQDIALKISKSAERKKQNVLLTNGKEWIFTFMEGVENAGSNTVAGTGSGDVATNGIPFWLTVDLKKIKTVTGIQTKHWNTGFAPTKVEIFTSENGREWVSIGQVDTKGSTQTITFEKPVDTRYLKYQMITVPSRVDITKFNIYSWE